MKLRGTISWFMGTLQRSSIHCLRGHEKNHPKRRGDKSLFPFFEEFSRTPARESTTPVLGGCKGETEVLLL
jgi:hypothetical protein